MFRNAILVSLFLVSSLLSGCVSATATFSPYSSVGAPPPPVTAEAIEIRPGDRQYLKQANPKVLGWVSSQGEPGDPEIVHAAKLEAAKQGGTHILLRGAKTDVTIDAMPFLAGAQVDESQRASYVVLRVAPEDWGTLPDVLQPKALGSAAAK